MSRNGLRGVVIGAGLAGLACAGDLTAAGATVRVLEAGAAREVLAAAGLSARVI